MRIIRRIALAAVLVLAGAGYAWTQLTPVPALPDAERRTTYTASGAGPYAVGFALYGDGTDYTNWLQVYVNGVATTAYTLTSLSGTIGNIALPITDAQITFSVAPTGTIQIVGARRPRRTSQLSENRGVSAHDFNVIITDIQARQRETWDQTQGRVIQVPPGETAPMLPPAAQRANTNLTFDGSGNPIASLPAGGTYPISSAMAPVVNAASTASAASQLGVAPVPVGTILQYAGYTAPASYDFAYGQSYARVNFPALMAALTSSQTGTCNGTTTITGLSDTSQFVVGQRIEGSMIPSLTNTVASILGGTSITVSSAATSSGSCTVQIFPYGNGDGLTTFNLPDLRGNVVAGRDTMGGSAAGRLTSTYFGAAAGLGAAGGAQSSTLLTTNLPPYTPAGTITPTGTITGSVSVLVSASSGAAGGGNLLGSVATQPVTITDSRTWPFAGTAQGGASTPISRVQPSIQMNYIVRIN